jgi:hypothetical protein
MDEDGVSRCGRRCAANGGWFPNSNHVVTWPATRCSLSMNRNNLSGPSHVLARQRRYLPSLVACIDETDGVPGHALPCHVSTTERVEYFYNS